jgi:hypothetical protein
MTEHEKNLLQSVVNHLKTMSERSGKYMWDDVEPEVNKFHCLYRGPNGGMCAAGFLIKDEYYHEGLEGASVCYGRSVREAIIISQGLDELKLDRGSDFFRALGVLQETHDAEDCWVDGAFQPRDYFKGRMKEVYPDFQW